MYVSLSVIIICNEYCSSVRSSVDSNIGLSESFIHGFGGGRLLLVLVLVLTKSLDTGGVAFWEDCIGSIVL